MGFAAEPLITVEDEGDDDKPPEVDPQRVTSTSSSAPSVVAPKRVMISDIVEEVNFKESLLSAGVASPEGSVCSPVNDDFEQMLSEMSCPICLDSYIDPVSLACGHTLCKGHVFELAAMFNHPDTGLIEFDCPKCRVKCKFEGNDEVRVNLEMRNMINLVQKAAKKTDKQRRSEREKKLLAQLKKYETTTKEMREKEHKLECEKRVLTDAKRQFEIERSDGDRVGLGKQQQLEAEKLARERDKLKRERQLVEQQRSEVNRKAHELLTERKVQPQIQNWDGMDLESKEREFLRLKQEAKDEKQRLREERDKKIQAELENWLRKTEDTQRRAIEDRKVMQDRIARFEANEEKARPRVEKKKPEPPKAPPTAPHEESQATAAAAPNTYFSQMKQLPPKQAVTVVESAQIHSRGVNPITNFPDPCQIEEIAEVEDRFKIEEVVFRKAFELEKPPEKRPEEYPNYHYSLTDGVDHELNQVLEEVDAGHVVDIRAAYDKCILAEKARIAEQRAMQQIQAFRIENPPSWDNSVSPTSSAKYSKLPRPSYKPKLRRMSQQQAISNPVPPSHFRRRRNSSAV